MYNHYMLLLPHEGRLVSQFQLESFTSLEGGYEILPHLVTVAPYIRNAQRRIIIKQCQSRAVHIIESSRYTSDSIDFGAIKPNILLTKHHDLLQSLSGIDVTFTGKDVTFIPEFFPRN